MDTNCFVWINNSVLYLDVEESGVQTLQIYKFDDKLTFILCLIKKAFILASVHIKVPSVSFEYGDNSSCLCFTMICFHK